MDGGRALHMQWKQEESERSESENAGVQFRRDLEELVRDHLHTYTCMALASCSSTAAHEACGGSTDVLSCASSFSSLDDIGNERCDDGWENHFPTHVSSLHSEGGESVSSDGQHQHQHQQQQEGENGRAGRRESILTRWAAHRAQEMITTIEREAREAELLTLSGLHAVSTLDSSFLREQEPSRRPEPPPPLVAEVSAETPQRRASSLVQMWREIEEERRRAELENRMALRLSARSQSSDSNVGIQLQQRSFNQEEEGMIGRSTAELNQELHQTEASVERPRRRASSLVQMWRQIEEERRRAEHENRMAFPLSAANLMRDEVERENRQDGIGNDNGIEATHLTVESPHESHDMQVDHRETALTEIGNATVLPGSEASDGSGSPAVEDRVLAASDGEREHVREIVQRLTSEGAVRDRPNGETQSSNRSAWLGEDERERVRELARVWVRVSNQQSVENGRLALGRHGGAVQRRITEHESASNLDYEQDASERISRDRQTLLDQSSILDLLLRIERERQRELEGLMEYRAVTEFAHRNRLQLVLRGRFLRNRMLNEEERMPSSAAGELGQLRERRPVTGMREGFHYTLERILDGQADDGSLESLEVSRSGENRGATGGPNLFGERGAVPARVSREWEEFGRVTDIESSEESTAYSMELQELLGRRSVTNVLGSEFRDSLDELVRSFIQSQGRTSATWDFLRSERNATILQQQEPQPQIQEETQNEPDSDRIAERNEELEETEEVTLLPLPLWPPPPPTLPPPPPPPPPPPMPLWQQELQQTSWSRPSLQRPSYMEWESINELRADNTKLQQKVSELQHMIGMCLEMQLELQRSIRQEVSGALQRIYNDKDALSDAINGSKWVTVKNGICCVCCDKNIDSLLYRCGHMCTCLNCATELIRSTGKCPMCRAPIAEVVRAFTMA